MIILDDHSNKKNFDKIKAISEIEKSSEIISLDHDEYTSIIKEQKNTQTYSNLASLLKSFEIGKEKATI